MLAVADPARCLSLSDPQEPEVAPSEDDEEDEDMAADDDEEDDDVEEEDVSHSPSHSSPLSPS